MSPRRPVLLVDGDREFGVSLVRELIADGFSVELVHSAVHARHRAGACPPLIALLGVLSSTPVRELLEEIRGAPERPGGWDRHLPVIVLGERPGGLEALRALEAGADDFMARPIGYLELRARVTAILRRAGPRPDSGPIEAGALRVEPASRRASLNGVPIELSRTEFDLLACLASAPDRVFTREELLRSIWGYRSQSATRTVDTHASRLRRKVAADTGERLIIPVRGIGYRLT